MKKIENIIENCIDCRFAQRYNHPDAGKSAARICTRMNPQRLAGFEGVRGIIDIPDWCPLETYSETHAVNPDAIILPDGKGTIILSGMPNLEWMTENLSGHGGTEIDGNWYYTWPQAMDAAAELGDGWRLPTREEFEQLVDAGSTWDDERKGRVFGWELFLPAAGYLHREAGAVSRVGTEGNYWSSSPYSPEVYAGYLRFYSGGVHPVNATSRASGLSVRCVREIK